MLGQQSEKEKEARLAAALGYAAHVTHHLAVYLGVPLKYPIRPANSHSAMIGEADPISTASFGRYSLQVTPLESWSSTLFDLQLHLRLNEVSEKILSRLTPIEYLCY